MKVIHARNVHQALPIALRLLYKTGIERPSRNGPVLQSPVPVATVYERPQERVVFWPERDASPALHLYESLWMLAGRNDVAPLTRYTKQFEQYTDDGATFHGAYGHRWRQHFFDPTLDESIDQLSLIAKSLKGNPTDRRCVLGMWDPSVDLAREGKDLPCNDTATFQIGSDGRLDLVVFCRSNDIVWGAYGANAVHFSFLLEYMSAWIGVPMGTYTQVSVNWHGYLETLEKVKPLVEQIDSQNPYASGLRMLPLQGPIESIDEHITGILREADTGFKTYKSYSEPWADMMLRVLKGHHIWKTEGKDAALSWLWTNDYGTDWERAAVEWIQRRKK